RSGMFIAPYIIGKNIASRDAGFLLFGALKMSKYDELVELSKRAGGIIATYQRDSIGFVEAAANAWSDYLGVEVNLTSKNPDSDKLAESAWDSMSLNEDTGYWHFALSVLLFPNHGQLTIPLLFKKVNDTFQLKIANDQNNKTFRITELNEEGFKEFCDYLFESLKEYFQNFTTPGEHKPIYGFTRQLLKESNKH